MSGSSSRNSANDISASIIIPWVSSSQVRSSPERDLKPGGRVDVISGLLSFTFSLAIVEVMHMNEVNNLWSDHSRRIYPPGVGRSRSAYDRAAIPGVSLGPAVVGPLHTLRRSGRPSRLAMRSTDPAASMTRNTEIESCKRFLS